MLKPNQLPTHGETSTDKAAQSALVRWVREPFLHFVLIGVAIYVLYGLFGQRETDVKERVRKDWESEKRQELNDQYIQGLLARYDVHGLVGPPKLGVCYLALLAASRCFGQLSVPCRFCKAKPKSKIGRLDAREAS